MKRPAASVTSLPQAPADEDRRSVRSYAITMLVRTVCFLLAVLVTPYGWYTWVFAIGAIVLPYVAVVIANAGRRSAVAAAQTPTRELDSAEPVAGPVVIQVREAPK